MRLLLSIPLQWSDTTSMLKHDDELQTTSPNPSKRAPTVFWRASRRYYELGAVYLALISFVATCA